MVAALWMFAVEVQQIQQSVQPPVDAGDISKKCEDKHHAEGKKYNGGLSLDMEKIEGINGDQTEEDHKNVDWKIAGAPVLAARQFQKLQAPLHFAKFHLRQDFLLFRRQFSDEVFGEHGL